MNNTLHTGGDWYVQRIHIMKDKTPHDHDIWDVYSTQKTIYVDKPQHICSFNWKTPAGKANAHLISAAPDLLSALETLLSAVEFIECQSDEGRLFSIERLHMGHDKGIREAKEAIAKAKGEA